MAYKAKKLILRFLAICFGIILAFFIAEIGLRLVGFEFQLYPSRVEFGYPDPASIQRLYAPDKDLLWVQKDYPKRLGKLGANQPAVVFMGCSCTEFGSFPKELARQLSERYPDAAFNYLNLGVGGWTTYQGLQQLKRDVVPLKPKIIVVYYGWNDHWRTFGFADKDIGAYSIKRMNLLLKLSAKSRILQLVNRFLFAVGFHAETAEQRVSLPDFKQNLLDIVRIAREHGIEPVLVTAPSAHQPGEEPQYLKRRWLNDLSELVPLHLSYVQAVREVARDKHVHLLDLYRMFRELPMDDLRESFVQDGIHLTEQGSRRVANYLYDYFQQAGLMQDMMQ